MLLHIELVSILFVVWGAMTAVIGASLLALAIGAFSLMASAARTGAGSEFAAGFAATVFTTLAVLAIVWGTAHIIVGLPLRRRAHWSRLAALMLASVDLVLLPYGTALGCYTLATLLREDAKRRFDGS
jgi:hypothetical protein